MKAALRARERPRLGALRLILAAIQQREVDSRSQLGDAEILAVLDKMVKQRLDSIAQYEKAGREDLVTQECFELGLIRSYLPVALGDEEIDALIVASITDSGAQTMRDMGKVMGRLKPQLQGRADMAAVSARVKARLSGR
jgi:uncharacterized protein YqeY